MGRLMKNISFLFCWSALVGFAVAMVLVLNVPSTLGQAKKALVDLNSASEKELEALPGVGPATAKKITVNRPYKSVDELSKAGLSEIKIEALKPLVTVGAAPSAAKPETIAKPAPAVAAVTKAQPTGEKPSESAVKLAPGQKVNINTASKEQLEGLLGIEPRKAQAIIDGRPYQKTEDITKVKGIKQEEFDKVKDLIFAGEPYHHEGPGLGPRLAHLSRIEGIWLANINNRPGKLEFHWTGDAWTGRILIDALGRWEELTDVFIDPRTGQVQFHRPFGNQRYYGTLSGERIEGTFGIRGPGNLPWAAWRH
jgi:competence ComEA-like helix-hairpin-helix protein